MAFQRVRLEMVNDNIRAAYHGRIRMSSIPGVSVACYLLPTLSQVDRDFTITTQTGTYAVNRDILRNISAVVQSLLFRIPDSQNLLLDGDFVDSTMTKFTSILCRNTETFKIGVR
jgi:hypothetical protein